MSAAAAARVGGWKESRGHSVCLITENRVVMFPNNNINNVKHLHTELNRAYWKLL